MPTMDVTCCKGKNQIPIPALVSGLGCLLVVFSFGNENTFGNMNPYMTSYLRNRSQLSTDVDYGDTLWLATGKIATASVFMPILALLEQIMPSRLCILLGVWTLSLSTGLTYFSLSHSFVATIFTDGVFVSMGRALAYPVTLRLALRLFPNRKGILVGILSSAVGASAFAFNQIITRFINPHNLSPDQNVNDNLYFTQPEVLDKIPYCFLLLGGILAVISTTGVILMKDPTQEIRKTNDDSLDEAKKDFQASKKNEDETKVDNISEVIIFQGLSPAQMMCTVQFYIAWLMYFFIGFAMDMYGVLYKSYGQTFIDDDHFLSLVASFSAAASAVGNLTWGFLADKFTYKPTLMALITVYGVSLGTFITTEYGGKAMFFIWACVMNFAATGIFVLLPLMVLDLFGNEFYSVNYGMVHSAGVAYGLISALLTSQIKDIVGWHGIFLIAGGLPIISFLFSTVLYLKKYELNP